MIISITRNNVLNDTAVDTAAFLLFFDKLFDSVNGSTIKNENKPLWGPIRTKCEQLTFWHEARKVLQTIRFVNKNKKESVPPSIIN